MPDLPKAPGMHTPNLQPKIPATYAHLFRLGYSVNGFEPVGGNCATLLPDSNATIESMVADIDASQDHVHLIFYIWLPDNNGLKVVGPHLHRPTGADHHDSLLCARRRHADSPLCPRPARREDPDYFPRAKRLMDRSRGQSQLLQ